MRVTVTAPFRAMWEHMLHDFTAGQELAGELAAHLHHTGAPVQLVDEPAAVPDEPGQSDGQGEQDGQTPAAPAVRDPKEAWVAHAVAQGADPDEAATLTKDQLVTQYRPA